AGLPPPNSEEKVMEPASPTAARPVSSTRVTAALGRGRPPRIAYGTPKGAAPPPAPLLRSRLGKREPQSRIGPTHLLRSALIGITDLRPLTIMAGMGVLRCTGPRPAPVRGVHRRNGRAQPRRRPAARRTRGTVPTAGTVPGA